ncbi:hypothetical protein BVY02_00365 [bacterium J17]|nr:hypothetical protein BVY02_00365 [bacterium J17]
MSIQPDSKINLINYCICHFGYKKYLEIGCKQDKAFAAANAEYRVGVDPVSGGTHRMTSDEYFSKFNENFDLIFIDGLHQHQQVIRDIENSLSRLSANGTILMHDCNPQQELHQRPEPVPGVWNGDVWKAYVHYRQRADLDMITGDFSEGMGIIRVRGNTDPIKLQTPCSELTWEDLVENRQRWLRLTNPDQVKNWL